MVCQARAIQPISGPETYLTLVTSSDALVPSSFLLLLVRHLLLEAMQVWVLNIASQNIMFRDANNRNIIHRGTQLGIISALHSFLEMFFFCRPSFLGHTACGFLPTGNSLF